MALILRVFSIVILLGTVVLASNKDEDNLESQYYSYKGINLEDAKCLTETYLFLGKTISFEIHSIGEDFPYHYRTTIYINGKPINFDEEYIKTSLPQFLIEDCDYDKLTGKFKENKNVTFSDPKNIFEKKNKFVEQEDIVNFIRKNLKEKKITFEIDLKTPVDPVLDFLFRFKISINGKDIPYWDIQTEDRGTQIKNSDTFYLMKIYKYNDVKEEFKKNKNVKFKKKSDCVIQ